MAVDQSGTPTKKKSTYKPPAKPASKPVPHLTPNAALAATLLAPVLGPPKQPVPRPAPKPAPKPVKSSKAAIDFLAKTLTSKTSPKPTNTTPVMNGVPIARATPAKAAPKPAPKAPVRAAPVTAKTTVHSGVPIVSSNNGSAAPRQATIASSTPTGTSKSTSSVGSSGASLDALQSFIDQAKKSVTAEDLPALNDLQRQIDDANARAGRSRTDIETRGKAEYSNLGEIFNRLGNFTQQVQQTNDANYQDLGNRTGTVYDQLQQQLAATYGNAGQAAQSEADRLGLGDYANTAGIQRDAGFLQGLAGTDKANALAGLNQSQGGFDSLMSMMQGNAASEGASRQAVSMRNTNKSIDDLQFELNQALTGLSGKRGDIVATEGQRIQELAHALQDKQVADSRSQAQQEFENNLAVSKFGLDKQQADAALAAANAGPSYSDQLDVAYKKAQLDKLLNPTPKTTAVKRTPEQEAKYRLHAALDDPKNPDSNRNMTDLWNIVQTLRLGNYDDVDHNLNDGVPHIGKFSANDPILLKHLTAALNNRFKGRAGELQGPALDIIRALTGQ